MMDIGKGIQIEVDWSRVPDAAIARLVARGLRDFPIGGPESETVAALLRGNKVSREAREAAAQAAREAGMRNALMDAHVQVRKDEPGAQDKARALAEKRLATIYAGTMRTAAGPRGSKLDTIMKDLATRDAKAAFAKQGKKASKELLTLSVKRRIEGDVGGLRARAEAVLAAQAAEVVEVELGEDA